MAVVTTFQLVDCNEVLTRLGLGYRVHLHDACGGQFLTIETLPRGNHDAQALRTAIETFFAEAETPVEFNDDGTMFWAR